jgi:hypothetical protein
LAKERPLYDVSALQPDLAKKMYSKIIVLHSSGTDSSRFETIVAGFEREFLRHGVTVISGAVTGRVVLDVEKSERKTEAAAQLTDIERALVMARRTGAEAVLQIGAYERLPLVEARYLVHAKGSGIRETDRETYLAWPGDRTYLSSGASLFVGKLIDVSSGEVVASFKVGCATFSSFPADIHGTAQIDHTGKWTITNTTYPLFPHYQFDSAGRWVPTPPDWEIQARARCDERIIQRLIGLSLSKETPSPATSASPVLAL